MEKFAALLMLDDFCTVNGIEYVLTGTMALDVLGVPSNPGDIDIKVYQLTDAQITKLKELQFLSGLDNEVYENKSCYSFLINGIKINVIIANPENDRITVCILEGNHMIKVQSVISALKSKMDLRREKDKTYMLNLIANLAQL